MEPFLKGQAWFGSDSSDESQMSELAGNPDDPGTAPEVDSTGVEGGGAACRGNISLPRCPARTNARSSCSRMKRRGVGAPALQRQTKGRLAGMMAKGFDYERLDFSAFKIRSF